MAGKIAISIRAGKGQIDWFSVSCPSSGVVWGADMGTAFFIVYYYDNKNDNVTTHSKVIK